MEEAISQLNKYREAYQQGVENAIEYATKAMYDVVLNRCAMGNIQNDISDIHMEYDKNTKTGRVWTNNSVIIFNEMGTGIRGSNNPHPNPNGAFADWKYDVNSHGEKGWVYPKSDGTFGWTKGLPSKHMFYDAFNDVKDKIGDIVSIEIRKTTGGLY